MSMTAEKRNYILKIIAVAIVVCTVVALLSVIIWDYVKPKEPFYIIFNYYPDKSPTTVEFSEDMEMPETDDIDGYTFDGWYYSFGGEQKRFDPSTFDPDVHNPDGLSENFLDVYGKWVYKEE